MKLRRLLLVALAAICCISTPVHAQADLTGRVMDISTGEPVEGARIELPALRRTTRSDAEGRFALGRIGSGAHRLRVSRLGYRPLDDRVDPARAGGQGVTIWLVSETHVLEPVTASATASSRRMAEFERRRVQQQGGQFVTRQELEHRELSRLTDVLRQLRGAEILSTPMGTALYLASTRGGAANLTGPPQPCFAQVYLDGVPFFDDPQGDEPTDLTQFLVRELEAIEYYAGPASTPVEFRTLNSKCGTLVLWTRDPR